jgi:tetratricopeptide (TPR) repeat protein
MGLGEYEEALSYFDKLLTMEPSNGEALQYMNRVLDMLRRY